MKLNKWQRIGVVLSVLWIFGSAVYTRNSQVESATESASRVYQMCMDVEGVQSKNCSEQFKKTTRFFEAEMG